MKTLGPPDARIVIITDFPSNAERSTQSPLSDYAGGLFFDLLSRKGLLKNNCFVISVLETTPPDDDIDIHLSKRKTCPGPAWENANGTWVSPELAVRKRVLDETLARVNPSLVITLGELGLWVATGHRGVTKWRGSRLGMTGKPWTVLPTIHPRGLVRDPSQSHILQIDLARAKALFEGTQESREYDFIIEPTFEQACYWLDALIEQANFAQSSHTRFRIAPDLETRGGHIACLGIAWSATEAICLPFLTVDDGKPFYWTFEEEAVIVHKIARLFMHPAVDSVGQNYLYDCQYFWRHWGIVPSSVYDTMIGHHSCFSNMRKGLDFLSAMYSQDHIYWKDESKEWDPTFGERQYWTYNCKDAVITYEIWQEIVNSMEEMNG